MDILLVHGLGRTPYSMQSLGTFLKQWGHRPHYFGYAAFAESYDHIVMRLQQRLRQAITQPSLSYNYAIVAHSLGGLLSRSALMDQTIAPPQSLIMLGTPNQSPQAARWAWKLWPFQWFSGQCGANLSNADFFPTLPHPHFPYHIIAGTGGWSGWGSPFGSTVNDGLVTIHETRISDRDSILEFPVFHTFMMNDPAIQQVVVNLLTHAR